jgi:hypothetical protein
MIRKHILLINYEYKHNRGVANIYKSYETILLSIKYKQWYVYIKYVFLSLKPHSRFW